VVDERRAYVTKARTGKLVLRETKQHRIKLAFFMSYKNDVIDMCTREQIIGDDNTKVATKGNNGKWSVKNMKLIDFTFTKSHNTALINRNTQLPLSSPVTQC